ncbi:TM10B methyltransferase, partial [Psilopogon haemacephalus]|nr:TM10B methyltransferase [Psilopogon haemacephalus]
GSARPDRPAQGLPPPRPSGCSSAPEREAAAMAGGSGAGGGLAVELEGEVAVSCEALRLLRIEPSAASPGAGQERGAEPCSRNVLRKRRRWERVLAARRRKRTEERERNRARRAENPGMGRRGTASPTDTWLGVGEAPLGLGCPQLALSGAVLPWVCVSLLCCLLKETSRLASQIRRLYGANRRAEKPFWLYLTEFAEGSLIYRECLRMNDGFSNYLVRLSDHNPLK